MATSIIYLMGRKTAIDKTHPSPFLSLHADPAQSCPSPPPSFIERTEQRRKGFPRERKTSVPILLKALGL